VGFWLIDSSRRESRFNFRSGRLALQSRDLRNYLVPNFKFMDENTLASEAGEMLKGKLGGLFGGGGKS
jgi:hypothetical protein